MPDQRCRILRRQLVHAVSSSYRARTRAKNEIHALVAAAVAGQAAVLGSVRGQGPPMARGLELPPEERESVDAGMRHIEFLDAEIAAAEKLIAQQALSWPEIRQLMTILGEFHLYHVVHRRGR